MELADALNLIQHLLKCPVCLNDMFKQIFQCRNGHSVCGTCKSMLTRCVFCRENKINIRNLSLERIVEKSVFPCKFRNRGCLLSYPLCILPTHHRFCPFNVYSCYLQAYPRIYCNFQGTVDGLQSHLKVHHSCFTAEQQPEGFTFFHLLGFQPLGRWNIIITAFEKVFNCSFITDHEDVYAYLNLVGTAEEARKYRHEITIMNTEKTEYESYGGKVLSVYVDELQKLKNTPCFHSTFRSARRLMKGHTFLLVMILVTKHTREDAVALFPPCESVWDVRGIARFGNVANASAYPNLRMWKCHGHLNAGPSTVSESKCQSQQKQNVAKSSSFSLSSISRETTTKNIPEGNPSAASQLQPSSVVHDELNGTATNTTFSSSCESLLAELSDTDNEAVGCSDSLLMSLGGEKTSTTTGATAIPNDEESEMAYTSTHGEHLKALIESLTLGVLNSASYIVENSHCSATDTVNISHEIDQQSKSNCFYDSDLESIYYSPPLEAVNNGLYNPELSSTLTDIPGETEVTTANMHSQPFLNSPESLASELVAVCSDRISNVTTRGAVENHLESSESYMRNDSCSPSSETQSLKYRKLKCGPFQFNVEKELDKKCYKEKLNELSSLRNANEGLTYDEARAVDLDKTTEHELSHFKFETSICSRRITTPEVTQREELNEENSDENRRYDGRVLELHEAPNCRKLNARFHKICTGVDSVREENEAAEESSNKDSRCEEARATKRYGNSKKGKNHKKKSQIPYKSLYYYHHI